MAFSPQVESFASAGYRAVAWDMPGYGYSPPVEPYTFKALAESCIDLIDQLLESEARLPSGHSPDATGGLVLLGHSMGGMVAQEVVARRPDKVRRLILCGTSAAFGKRSDGQAAQAWAGQFVAARTAPLDAGKSMAEVAQMLVPKMVGPGAMPEGARLAEHCMAGVPAATYRRALDALVRFDRQAELAQIRVPTLLIGGEFDRVAAPTVMKQMADSIPRARYAELAGMGHLMNLEAPDEFDALVLNFLREPWPKPLPDHH